MMRGVTDHRPWFASYPPEVPHTLEPYPDLSVFGMLERSARAHPYATAIGWFGKRRSYAWLLTEVERCSAALAGLGVDNGDRVALVMPNCPQYIVAFYATAARRSRSYSTSCTRTSPTCSSRSVWTT